MQVHLSLNLSFCYYGCYNLIRAFLVPDNKDKQRLTYYKWWQILNKRHAILQWLNLTINCKLIFNMGWMANIGIFWMTKKAFQKVFKDENVWPKKRFWRLQLLWQHFFSQVNVLIKHFFWILWFWLKLHFSNHRCLKKSQCHITWI